MAGGTELGFYGKVPGRGDFITRRLPRTFIDPWDAWLQQAVTASRDQLGDAWLDAYLTSPLWRFVLDGGLCGDAPWAGVMMPSVDRVGRYFPLTLACPLEAESDPCLTLSAADGWFLRIEDLMLAALDDDFDVERFDAGIAALAPPAIPTVLPCAAAHLADGWRIALGAATLEAGCAPVLSALARARFAPCSFWYTAGSETIAPQLLVRAGLPAPASFAMLLNGAAAPPPAAEDSDFSALLADE